MMIDNGSRKIHIEPIGGSPKITDVRMSALLVAAINQAVVCLEEEKSDPTPEEMLSIGLAIGMYETNRSKIFSQPRQSLWKTAARLGI